MSSAQKAPMGTTVINRREWAARPPAGPLASQLPPTEAFLHYTENSDGESLTTTRQRATAVRQIQRFHIDGRGWSDLAYHYVVFQGYGGPLATESPAKDKVGRPAAIGSPRTAGSIFAGRSAATVPAAQQGHNTGTLAIAVYAGPGDAITRRTVYLIESLLKRHPTVRTLGGHRDVVPTECPGDRLYAQIPRIAAASGVGIYPRRSA